MRHTRLQIVFYGDGPAECRATLDTETGQIVFDEKAIYPSELEFVLAVASLAMQGTRNRRRKGHKADEDETASDYDHYRL